MEQEERHYKIKNLNILFALSSVGLLLVVVWMLADDYSRIWKDYQEQFHILEIEKTRVKYDSEFTRLEDTAEYKESLAELAQAKKEYAANCASATEKSGQIKKWRAENELLAQQKKFTSAKLDAARYAYEAAHAQHDANVEQSKKKYDALKEKLDTLNLAVEKLTQNLDGAKQKTEECGKHLKEIEGKERAFESKLKVLNLKLSKIDPDQMNFTNRIAQIARDLPILDLANPDYKVEQIVLKDITDDVNFMEVPKVDRCITCHLGIDNPDYADADQPFKTHPQLDVFLGRDSAHPMEEFGCTVCHGGRGRGTDFSSSAHTPSSESQAKEWKEKYHWHEVSWEKPMLPKQYVQAGCFKCHSGQAQVKGAEKLNLGLHIIEKAGCYSCHLIDKYKDWPKPGPDLTKLASKVSKDWAYRWIDNPHAFRSGTWMPAFFHQSNNSDPESQVRMQQEIHAIAEYLFKKSETFPKNSIPVKGNPETGKELVSSVGCMACHQIDSGNTKEIGMTDALRREQGPNFTGIGTKTSEKWIYNWIKDPNSYHAGTRMPNLRLTDQEAADIAAYLTSLTNEEFNNAPIPAINEAKVDEIVFGFLVKSKTHEQAQSDLQRMVLSEKLELAGEKLVRHYGCFSCHNIAGFEKDKPIGTELTEEGDKSIHKLDFGFIPIDSTNYAWFTQKLKDPRIFDQGKVKAPDEKLRMPDFHLNDTEIEAVVTAILGFVRERPESKVVPRTVRNLEIERGQKIIRQMNCRGCHIIEGEGGSVQPSIQEWLVNYDNRTESDADAVRTSFSPPNLIGEGRKVKSEWLFNFIHSPETIRPWLKVRMPTYNFTASELNDLLKYFNALDSQEFPFSERVDTSLSPEEYAAAEKLFSADYFDCAKCHIVGNKLPGGSPANWAPNFAHAKNRLKADWIIDWITDPQSLLPGTKMPNYFDPAAFDASGPDDILNGDEHAQIRVLRNYLLTLSEGQSDSMEKTESVVPAPQAIGEEAPPTVSPAAEN